MIIKVPTDKKTTHAHSCPCSVAVDHLFFRTAVRNAPPPGATVDELIEIIRSRMDAQQESEDEGE